MNQCAVTPSSECFAPTKVLPSEISVFNFLTGKVLVIYCFLEIKVVINDRFFRYEQTGKQQPNTKQKEMKCNRWTLRADKADILRWLQRNELNRSHPTLIGLSQVMFTTNESDLVSSLAYIEKDISLKRPRLGSLLWAKCFKDVCVCFLTQGILHVYS